MITKIYNSGVPRVIDIEVPLPGLSAWGKRFKDTFWGPLDTNSGVLFWRADREYERTNLSQESSWLNIGRVFIRQSRNTNWEPCSPNHEDRTLLKNAELDFGRIQFSLEMPNLDEYGKGKVIFRMAWLPPQRAWDLAFVPRYGDLNDLEKKDKPVLAIVLDDLVFCSKAKEGYNRPPRFANKLNFGTSQHTQHIESMDTPFDRCIVDVLAIDFGTHQTNLAALRVDSGTIFLQSHPLPWFYQSISIKIADEEGKNQVCVRKFSDKDFLYPKPIKNARPLLTEDGEKIVSSFGFDSVSIQIPPERIGHKLWHEVALGAECRKLLNTDASLYHHLRPSPKLFLATALNQLESVAETTDDERVAFLFLREVFNSYATCISMMEDQKVITHLANPQKREVKPILYSFPISFTANQMDDLKKSFKDALKESTLSRSVQCSQSGEYDIQPYADESTAAALGVLFHKFGTLDPSYILDAHRPFRSDDAETPLRVQPLNVLCVDLGGGTSDLSLFTIDDARDQPGLEVRPRESFGFPRAGLAVTQAIASTIKKRIHEKLHEARKNGRYDRYEIGRNQLCTNFEPISLGRCRDNLTEHQHQVYAERRRRTQMWYEVAERIKKELCNGSEVSALTADDFEQLGLKGLDLSPAEITISSGDLETESRRVFALAMREVEKWLKKYPIDLVVLSGRSFRLPSIRSRFDRLFVQHNQLIAQGATELGRPIRRHNIIDLDWLKHNYGLLHENFNHPIDFDKALVPLGLLEKYNLQVRPFEGQALYVREVSNARRTRYIGAVMDTWLNEAEHFDEKGMLFTADHQPINPETDLKDLPLSPGTVRVSIAVNFLGPGRLRADSDDVEKCVDPPRHLGTVDIKHEPYAAQQLERITLTFRQLGATRIELCKVKYKLAKTDEVLLDPKHDGRVTKAETEFFSLTWSEVIILDDFRTDGKIDELGIDKSSDLSSHIQ